MGHRNVLWCDGCKDQQIVGPTFELIISHRQILPQRETKPTVDTYILCDVDNDELMLEIEKLIQKRIRLAEPLRIGLEFRPARAGAVTQHITPTAISHNASVPVSPDTPAENPPKSETPPAPKGLSGDSTGGALGDPPKRGRGRPPKQRTPEPSKGGQGQNRCECGQGFPNARGLRLHKSRFCKLTAARTKTEPEKPAENPPPQVIWVPCLSCGEKFPNARALGIHRTRAHFGQAAGEA